MSKKAPLTNYEKRVRWFQKYPEKKLYYSAYTNAWDKGYDFNITSNDTLLPPKCPVFNIPLYWTKGKRTDNTPSVDRMDTTKGYVQGNVAVVSWRANEAKGDLTIDEIRQLYDFYCRKRVYICGPMSNIPYFNFPKFFEAEKELKDQGFYTFNPAQADIDRYNTDFSNCPNGTHEEAAAQAGRPVTYKECLKVDLNWILNFADAIALLPGWENSKGCATEKALADCLKLEVIHLD